jgi:hypothetical protein
MIDDRQVVLALRRLREREVTYRAEITRMIEDCDRNIAAIDASLRKCQVPHPDDDQ